MTSPRTRPETGPETSPQTASRGRRSSSRSVRRVAAGLLLTLALVVGVAAIVVGSPLLVPGVVAAMVVTAVAAGLLNEETTRVRRDWARDRAVRAHQTTREATVRSREHTVFADHMAATVRAGRAEIERLLGELAVSAAALAEAERAYEEAVRRGDALESDVEELRRVLESTRVELRAAQDELAASRAAEVETRTELLAWQQGDESRRYA